MAKIYREINRIITDSKRDNLYLTYEEVKRYLRETVKNSEDYEAAIKYTADKLSI